MPVIIYKFTFFYKRMLQYLIIFTDTLFTGILWQHKNANCVIEFNWAVMSCEFSMVLHSSYSMQKTTWVFFKSWDEFTRHQRMTSAKFSWKTDDFNEKHKKLAVFLSIHEPKLWLWLAKSVTTRTCSVEICRSAKVCEVFSSEISCDIQKDTYTAQTMSNPESMSALTWKPSKSQTFSPPLALKFKRTICSVLCVGAF